MTFEDFLSENGLENLTREERKEAHKDYRKVYFAKYRKEQSQGKRRVDLRYDNKGYEALEKQAKRHEISVPQYVKRAVEGYEKQTFVVRDIERLQKLEFLLRQTANSVAQISFEAQRSNTVSMEEFQKLQTEIRNIRKYLKDALAFPPTAKSFLLQQQEVNSEFLVRVKRILDNLLTQET